jgi:SAM-dependent methyltransferase
MVQFGGRLWGRSPQFRDLYSREFPSPAAAFDIFRKEWASAVPGFETGKSLLFDDARLHWLEAQVGSFQNKRVLELGPLEGGQTWMMERGGADVLAIEANQRAFLKCLVVKNALHMRAEFLYGDFRRYLETAQRGSFDLVTAVGVLYHMTEPVKLLYDIARVTDTFAVWTHYYDRDKLGSNDLRFDPKPRIQTVEGRSVRVFQQNYLLSVTHPGFCGGSAPISFWLTKDGLLEYVESLGFEVTIGGEDPDHQSGPSILFLAKRR